MVIHFHDDMMINYSFLPQSEVLSQAFIATHRPTWCYVVMCVCVCVWMLGGFKLITWWEAKAARGFQARCCSLGFSPASGDVVQKVTDLALEISCLNMFDTDGETVFKQMHGANIYNIYSQFFLAHQ